MKASPRMNRKDVTSKGVNSRTNNVAGSNLEMANKNLSHNRPFLKIICFSRNCYKIGLSLLQNFVHFCG